MDDLEAVDIDILVLLAQGVPASSISHHVDLAPRSVQRRLFAIRLHFDARTNLHAVVCAIRGGVIP